MTVESEVARLTAFNDAQDKVLAEQIDINEQLRNQLKNLKIGYQNFVDDAGERERKLTVALERIAVLQNYPIAVEIARDAIARNEHDLRKRQPI